MKTLVVTNMYPNPEQPAFGTFVKDQVDALKRVGIEIEILFVNGRKHKLEYLWGVFRFWWILLRKRYHLIHAHHAMAGFIARLQFSYPVVVTYHGGEVGDHVPRWLSFWARQGTHMFDRIIVVNRTEKRMLHDDPKVRVIPCAVNLEEFCPTSLAEARHLLGLPVTKPLVLWAGEYWQYEKRFELVEASLQLLKEWCPEVELVLVSGKPHSVIPLYMSACDVLLLTSRSEGSPMVIKEAMACNLPVVSTDVGDVAEIIASVENCFLVEPDVADIADKLWRVLQSRRRSDGREKIVCQSSEPITRRIIAVYNEVCPPQSRFEVFAEEGKQ
jgi:glycosyltransferase involved in cell wall biosynthesis